MAGHPLIAMRGIVKRYPGVTALRDVDLVVEPGEVMALLGENGAGKSTLLKVLAGAVRPDEGTIEIRGELVEHSGPRDAQKHGIAVIYQELNLANDLTVSENIFVGREPRTRAGLVDFAEMRRRTRELFAGMGLTISPDAVVGDLNIALRQMIEIAKALMVDARLVIMDEPTSSLTEEETDTLFRLIARLRQAGVAIIYVSHRMREIEAVADRATVMRDGSVVGVRDLSRTSPRELVTMMVGREIEDLYGRREVALGADAPVALEVRGLAAGRLLHDVSFTVHSGEIVALSGLIGAGRSHAARAIFGALRRTAGQILINGESVRLRNTRDAMAAGVALVPEDRKRHGLFLNLSVRANVSAAVLSTLSRAGFVLAGRDRALSYDYAQRLNLRGSAVEASSGALSGGNQQKVLLARWLARHPRVLILDEPTRGVDVGAKSDIYRLVRGIAADGVAVLVISSELPEVLGIADRIVVMREGRGVGEMDIADASEQRIMALATGVAETHIAA